MDIHGNTGSPLAVSTGSPPASSKSPSSASTSPLTPSRKSRRLSKRGSGGGNENGETESRVMSQNSSTERESMEKKSPGKVLQMQGAEGEEYPPGFVILNDE